MSAEPVRPGTDHPMAATVLAFSKRRAGSTRHARRERTIVPPEAASELTPQQKLAASLEARFAQFGRTLTDAGSAQDFRITLGAVRGMLEGARHQGMLTEEAWQDLDAMLEGMLGAPGLLA